MMTKKLFRVMWANFLLRPWLDWPIGASLILVLRLAGPHPRTDLILGTLSVQSRSSIYVTIASITGALLGFYIASVAILITLFTSVSERFDKVFAGGRAALLVPTFFSAIRTAGLLTCLSLLLLVVDSSAHLSGIWLLVYLVLTTLMVLRTGRLIWLVWRLTKVAAVDIPGRQTDSEVVSQIVEDLR